MQVFVGKLFASMIENYPEEEKRRFIENINPLKKMSKTDIINSDCIVQLPNTNQIILYAYNTQGSMYLVFTFKDKNTLVLLDEIELINNREIRSLVYPQIMNQNNKNKVEAES